jgi:glycosyltransferase involved in cell wall biosynthesis
LIKVLHLSTFHLSGGAGLAATRLNRALNAHRVASTLLVGQGKGTEENVESLDEFFWGRQFFWGRFVAERLYFLPHEQNPAVRYSFSPAIVGADLADHPLVKQADVIHLHWVNFGLLSVRGIACLLALNKPIVWTLHDMWAFTGGCHYSGACTRFRSSCGQCQFLRNPGDNDLSHRRLQLKLQQWESNRRLSIVACSQWLATEARSSTLFRNRMVSSIPNAIDTVVFAPIDRDTALTELGLDVDKKYLLFAAAKVSSSLKGFDFLLEALRILCSLRPDQAQSLELLVIGGGDRSLIESVPLKAHYLGYISGEANLARVYSAASVYVTPSLEDNLPNTVMEAMACGTPVVGFDTGGIPEMIDHQTNGFVATYKSSASLAEGIDWVLRHDTGGKLSMNAREKVLSEYDEQVVAAQYNRLYESLLNR